MPNEFQYRVLAPADADAFRALRLRALQECPTAFTADHAATVQRPIRFFAAQIETTTDRFVIGAFAQNRLAAVLGAFRSDGAKLRHRGNLWGMYVAPEWRRQGVGRCLVRDAVDRLRTIDGVIQVHLSVIDGNPAARAMYLAHGFAVSGREPRAIQVDGNFYDEEQLVLLL